MNHTVHISHDEIFPLSSKNRPIQSHLKGCQQCRELVNVLRHASKLSKNLKSDKDRSHPSTMKLSETITQIYDGSISPQAAANFSNHVESCSQCFNYLAMTVEESLSPVPEKVLKEIEAYSDISLADKALEAAPGLIPPLKKSTETKERRPITIPRPDRPVSIPWAHKLEKLLVPQLAYALGLLIAVGGGAFVGFRYYQTTYRINKAETLLTGNHRIYMADTPRLSGGYAATGIGLLMDEDAPASFLTQALDLTEQAIENGSKSVKAKQLQAQIFIIQKDYAKADSVFALIGDNARHLDSVLNDLGVLKYEQEEWQEAQEYFESAIQANTNFIEAYYNLALAQNKLGKKEEAISTLTEFLKFTNDEGWEIAASQFLNELNK